MKNYYTTTEISKLLGVTTATVNGWINEKELKSFRTPGGHNRVRREALLEFMKNNNIPIPPELDTSTAPKLLIVEDDQDVREFITAVIKDLEYEVEVDIAEDGYTAGNKVVKFKPDVVILDIMLPGVNGFEICRGIRKELGDKVKVLAITGYFSDDNRKKMMDAGADGFMRKPMTLKELKKKIDKYIKSTTNKYYLKKKK
ncbi:MAG: response regulator [Elusimicrobiota bacterium]